MGAMDEDDEIRLRVSVSKSAHPELAEALARLPAKMRGERLRTLAAFGARLVGNQVQLGVATLPAAAGAPVVEKSFVDTSSQIRDAGESEVTANREKAKRLRQVCDF